MLKKILEVASVLLMTGFVLYGSTIEPIIATENVVYLTEYAPKSIPAKPRIKTLKNENYIPLSEEDIELISLLTMAEAEGESERGKRLVISTILNRVKSDVFPNTVKEVVYQSGQFSSMTNGRVDRCYVKDDIYKLVEDESYVRTDSEVIFFRAGKYSSYGTPMFQEGGHYFSSYN